MLALQQALYVNSTLELAKQTPTQKKSGIFRDASSHEVLSDRGAQSHIFRLPSGTLIL